MGFSTEWEEMYKSGKHNSIWPWSEVVSMTNRYFTGNKKRKLKVLELGCGAGANIPYFVSIGAEYYGIEGSITEVEKIQEHFKNNNVIVRQGDFTSVLPFDGEFDLILDRGSVTHNSTKDIQKVIALISEKLKKEGYYFGCDWFSTSYEVFTDTSEKFDIVDDNTKIFHSGYFEGLGTVHFSDKDHILQLFNQMEIVELYEKVETWGIPDHKRIAWWSFVAKK